MNVTHSTESMEIEDNHSYTRVTTNLYNSKDCSTDSLPSQGLQARVLECKAIGSLDAHEFVVTSLMQFSSIILDFTSVYLHRALLKLLDICNTCGSGWSVHA